MRGLTAYFSNNFLSGSLISNYPVAFPHNISRGHYLPARLTALFWLVSRQLFTLGFLAFAMREPTALHVYRFLTKIKFRAIYFSTGLGHY
jgi:hypothetical protein